MAEGGTQGQNQEKEVGALERKLMAVSAGIPSRRVGAGWGLRLLPPSWRSQTVAVVATVQGSEDTNCAVVHWLLFIVPLFS